MYLTEMTAALFSVSSFILFNISMLRHYFEYGQQLEYGGSWTYVGSGHMFTLQQSSV